MNKTNTRFDAIARYLHGLSALTIIWASVSGFYIGLANIDLQLKHAVASFNVSLTTVFIPFFIWRVWHRLRRGSPDYAPDISTLAKHSAALMHGALYVLTAIVLLSGVLMMRMDINVFGLLTLPRPLDNEQQWQLFSQLHNISTRILAVCVILHIAAVIRHQLQGYPLLQRMFHD